MVDSVSANLAQSPLCRTIKTARQQHIEMGKPLDKGVKITSLSKLMHIAAQLAQDGPPIDFVKIAQVRRAIADGSYKINPDQIAEIMLHSGSTDDQFI
jgi:flagellar biosynthesis anti-sigma factor FlgM